MFWKKLLGISGENTAVKFLRESGYKIIERNYRCKCGEIDIIAEEKGVLVFVEVKTIATDKAETAFDTIDSKKKEHISRAAEHYLRAKRKEDCLSRFDAIAIKYKNGKEAEVELIKGAF